MIVSIIIIRLTTNKFKEEGIPLIPDFSIVEVKKTALSNDNSKWPAVRFADILRASITDLENFWISSIKGSTKLKVLGMLQFKLLLKVFKKSKGISISKIPKQHITVSIEISMESDS